MSEFFRPHGEFHIYIDGQILVTEVTGPWNKELVDRWARECYPPAKQLGALQPYAGIVIVRGSMICPPDAMEALARVVRYSKEKLNCLAHIVVADRTVEGRDLIEAAYARIYEGVVAYNFFYEYAEAKTWADALLRAHGAGKPL
ncbi:MAG TPA: hypothetical protein VEC06_07695 [Paucimonas sp.]|nr:hypothetical protein [Paucimonas sp.]